MISKKRHKAALKYWMDLWVQTANNCLDWVERAQLAEVKVEAVKAVLAGLSENTTLASDLERALAAKPSKVISLESMRKHIDLVEQETQG